MTPKRKWKDRSEFEEHIARFCEPDGYCLHCGKPADRYHPVGPIMVTITADEEETHEFCNWECFGHWAAAAAGGTLIIDRN